MYIERWQDVTPSLSSYKTIKEAMQAEINSLRAVIAAHNERARAHRDRQTVDDRVPPEDWTIDA
jgi:hypothetical protein